MKRIGQPQRRTETIRELDYYELCCEGCGETYEFGKGFIWEYSGEWHPKVWCEACFRKMASEW